LKATRIRCTMIEEGLTMNCGSKKLIFAGESAMSEDCRGVINFSGRRFDQIEN
jgi:hypothetical protein